MYIFSILIANVANFVQTSVCTVLIIHYHGFAFHIMECIIDAVSNLVFIRLKFILENKYLSLYIPAFHYPFLFIYPRSGFCSQYHKVLSILRQKSNFLIAESSYSAISVAHSLYGNSDLLLTVDLR